MLSVVKSFYESCIVITPLFYSAECLNQNSSVELADYTENIFPLIFKENPRKFYRLISFLSLKSDLKASETKVTCRKYLLDIIQSLPM